MGFGNRIGVCAGLAEAGIGFVGELNVCGISMLSGNAGADAVRDWLGVWISVCCCLRWDIVRYYGKSELLSF